MYSGESRAAANWVGVKGRAKTLRAAAIAAAEHPVAAVVRVHAKAMQDPYRGAWSRVNRKLPLGY